VSPVHRLGHMRDDAAARAGTEPYSPIVIHLPDTLIRALDEHIVNRVNEDKAAHELDMSVHRDAELALALRYWIDHWPDVGPYSRPPGERTRPPASETSP
jgi:hypothetical protein